MKRKLISIGVALTLLGAGLTFGFRSGRAVQAYNSHNLIRLHIVPNSDASVDQALKHQVRQAVVEAMAPQFKNVRDVNEARRLVDANMERIRAVAARQVALAGQNYGVMVYHGRFLFPERHYGKLTLPAGEYEAVRIVLGAGRGQNWWCVLFPPLCMVDIEARETALPAAAGSGGELRVKFRSRLWEVARRHFAVPSGQVVRGHERTAKR
uniref:Stage II sporulation protein R n=1 Tax=Ammonifex degensii TaxID=42838 RepID=A0A7C1FDM9_9THEO